MFGVHVACMPLHGMMEKVVDSLISSTRPYIHVNSTVGMVSHVTFIRTYIALEFLLALELLHGQLSPICFPPFPDSCFPSLPPSDGVIQIAAGRKGGGGERGREAEGGSGAGGTGRMLSRLLTVVEVVQGGIRVEGDRTRGRDLSGERGRGTGRGRGRDSSGGHEEGQVGEVEGCKEKMIEEEKGMGKSDAVQRKVSKSVQCSVSLQKKKHAYKRGCGCFSTGFIRLGRANFSLALYTAGTDADMFARCMRQLGEHHARDQHEWEGGLLWKVQW